MWSNDPQDTSEQRRSKITCHSCRRRKVKCDRELPFCRVCVETGQACEYPARPMKPGPKLGSLQRPRARRQKDQSQPKTSTGEAQQARDQSSSPAEDDAEMIDRSVWCEESDTAPASSTRRRPSHSSSSSSRRKSAASQVRREDERGPSCRRSSQLNINDLAFILHPSHESSSPDQDASTAPQVAVESPVSDRRELYQEACSIIGLTPTAMDKILRIYFENMVAINLFHKPSFHDSLKTIASRLQLSALLAAIAGYAVQFAPFPDDPDLDRELQARQAPGQCLSSTLVSLASRCTDQALDECSDEAPPLCVLQALIVTTHCELTRGVRGRAWRSLGMCIRLAYELNFHLLDVIFPGRPAGASATSPGHAERWCSDEEKRRAWWAIWEMDVFASTIRRTPTAIDWTQMEVLLPMPDENWYRNIPAESCFFERDPGQRWRALHESESQSAKAWFIVINSLMKDAQVISCPRGVPPAAAAARESGGGNQDTHRGSVQYPLDDPEESRQKLEALANSVNCLVRTLPARLRFRQQFLSFAPSTAGQTESPRQLHCSIYNIYVMTQLARLMIHRYDVFGSQMASQLVASSGPEKRKMASSSAFSFQDQETPALKQYFEAADNILGIINRSSENHIQYINPFLSSTIWLAAAVQLVRKQFGGGGSSTTQTALVKTRFDVLYLTYKQCVSFWGTQTAMQQNLEIIEFQLEGINPVSAAAAAVSAARTAWARIPQKRRWIPNTPDALSGGKDQGCDRVQSKKTTLEMPYVGTEGMMGATCTANSTSAGLPETPPPSDVGGDQFPMELGSGMSQPAPSESVATTRNIQGSEYVEPPAQQLQQADPRFLERAQPLMPNTGMFDFLDMSDNVHHDMAMYASMDAWKDFQLPSDICDLLSGVSTY